MMSKQSRKDWQKADTLSVQVDERIATFLDFFGFSEECGDEDMTRAEFTDGLTKFATMQEYEAPELKHKVGFHPLYSLSVVEERVL
jgi:hypothetical protein